MKETVSLVLVLVLGVVSVGFAIEDTWIYKTDMPTARVFVGGSIIDGKIYIVSGAPTPSSVTSTVEMYDPITDTWTRKASIPSARCYPATCSYNGQIYVFGGTSPDMWSSARKNVYVYDPQTDTWTQKADMPYAIAGSGIAVVDDIIYLVGGSLSVSSPPVPTVMAYDPVTESWTQKADMLTARSFFSASVVDGKIYAIGGAKEDWSTTSYKQTEVYDPSTDTWTRKSDMPTKRWGLSTCVVDGKIYAIGGNSAYSAVTAANEVYDPVTDTWTTKSPMQQRRYGLFTALIGNKIYAIGGSVLRILSTVEEYDTGIIVTPPLPDFNGDGIVDCADICMMLDYWGTDEPRFDIAPEPSGDGIVDIQDLILLAEHLFEEIYPAELLAYWKLDETEGDIAENAVGDNHGIVSGEPLWQPADGRKDGALQFDGLDDFIVTDFVLNPANGPFSIFAWVKDGQPGQVVISQIEGVNWLMADTQAGTLMTELKASDRSAKPLQSQMNIIDGNWYRIGVVWDGSKRLLYVDGVVVAEDAQDGIMGSENSLYIGTDKAMEAGTFWSGLIDDVRIYNKALSAEEVAALSK